MQSLLKRGGWPPLLLLARDSYAGQGARQLCIEIVQYPKTTGAVPDKTLVTISIETGNAALYSPGPHALHSPAIEGDLSSRPEEALKIYKSPELMSSQGRLEAPHPERSETRQDETNKTVSAFLPRVLGRMIRQYGNHTVEKDVGAWKRTVCWHVFKGSRETYLQAGL